MVSIIIPTYNRRMTICRTINSVLSQTYSNYEIIVIDDGSLDNTMELVEKKYGKEKVSYFYKRNEGVQIARNTGLFLARGEYILFLDSDDELLPEALEKCIAAFDSDENLGAVYFLTGLRNSKGNLSCARNDTLEGNCYKDVLLQGYLTSTSFIMFRKSVFAKIGIWDYSFPACQDDDMCFRLSKYFKIKLISEILGIFGTDDGEHIGSSPLRVEKGWFTLWRKYEYDIVSLCGKSLLLSRYRNCFVNFSNLHEEELAKTTLCFMKNYNVFYTLYSFGIYSLCKLKHNVKRIIGKYMGGGYRCIHNSVYHSVSPVIQCESSQEAA